MKKQDDKRRIPYNIWINVIGIVIFLAIASVGLGIMWIGLSADQRAVVSKEETIQDNPWTGEHEVKIKYAGTETISNWQDSLCRGLVVIIGGLVIVSGLFAWGFYAQSHYWYKGDYR